MAEPTNYYVDPANGDDDTGDGLTSDSAFKTIQKALDTIEGEHGCTNYVLR